MKCSDPRLGWVWPFSASLWLAAIATGPACGQTVFDPYRPYSAPYNASTQPDYPTNIGLPNVAREARNFDARPGVGSRADSYDKFAVEDEAYGSGRRRMAGARSAPADPSRREGAPASETKIEARLRQAEQKLADREAAAAQLEKERDRLYRAALKENDPTKRAQILREMKRLNSNPKPTGRADAGRPAPAGATGPIPPRRPIGSGVLAPPDDRPVTGSTSSIPPRPRMGSERRPPAREESRPGPADGTSIPPRPTGTGAPSPTSTIPARP